jgi:hypothetical protein
MIEGDEDCMVCPINESCRKARTRAEERIDMLYGAENRRRLFKLVSACCPLVYMGLER